MKKLYFPIIFVVIIWLVKLVEIIFNLDFAKFGILPLTLEGLKGIVFSPLIHQDLKHLTANTIPLLVLTSTLFYFYDEIAYKIFLLLYIVSNIWVWSFGREAYHIGASGVVYGLASFLFFSGLIRKYTPLMAISLLVVFLYGGIIWGVFPKFFPDRNISWEAHLMGAISGFIFSFFFKNEGPQRKKYSWETEEELNPEDEESVNEFLDKNFSDVNEENKGRIT